MNSSGAEDPQRGARSAGAGDNGALAAAGLGTWCWNTLTDAFTGDRCCLQQIDALDSPPHTFDALLRLVHPADRSLLRGALRDATGTHATTSIAFRVGGGDREVRWLQCLVARRAPLPGDVDSLLVGVLGPAGAAFPGPGAAPRPDLQHALQAAPVASAKFDRRLGLVHANARFLETLRLQQFDWQDRTLFDALPELPATWREAIARCLSGEGLQGAAEGFERADGSHDRVDGHVYPWYDNRDEIGGVLLIIEVRATAADARFTLVIDQAPVALAVADAHGQVRYANPAWIGLVGRRGDEILGADVLQYLHADDRVQTPALPGRTAAGGDGEREVRLVMPSGEVRWIDLLGRPMGSQSGAAAIIYAALDVTGRARQQRESGRMLAQLRELVLHLDEMRGYERSQTAQTLQYGLYESLFGLHAELERRARDADAAAPDTDAAEQLAQRSHAAVEQLRHVLFELAPLGVPELGLAGALERACSEQRDRTGLPIELALPPKPVAGDDQALDALYQAGREALIDATTHDGVSRIRVQVDLQPGAIRLRVEDNGFGQSEADARARGRNSGLLAASLRLRALGGTMRVLGVAGVATTVEVSIPAP